jgi:predicted ABC-type ATPase
VQKNIEAPGVASERIKRDVMGHSIERDINASRYSTVTLAELTHVITQAYRDDPILPSIAKL